MEPEKEEEVCSTRIHIRGLGQKMPETDGSWHDLLNNSDNETDLIKLFAEYLKSNEIRKMFNVPVFFTEKETTYKIDQNGWREIFSCNHEEADYRLVLHASLYDTPCVVRSKDTDVLVLLAFGYNRMKPPCNWFMQYENTADTYADISMINMYLDANIVSCLPHYHALSGCDTPSFFYNRGKIPTLKKIQKIRHLLNLLKI